MKLLLDTHAFLFAISDWDRLGPQAQRLLREPDVERWVSAVTLWEIAIKVQIGGLPLPKDRAFYVTHLDRLTAQLLAVEPEHSFALFNLPLHHGDPFDRMLIAQARVEGLTIATRDRAFSRYDVPVVW